MLLHSALKSSSRKAEHTLSSQSHAVVLLFSWKLRSTDQVWTDLEDEWERSERGAQRREHRGNPRLQHLATPRNAQQLVARSRDFLQRSNTFQRVCATTSPKCVSPPLAHCCTTLDKTKAKQFGRGTGVTLCCPNTIFLARIEDEKYRNRSLLGDAPCFVAPSSSSTLQAHESSLRSSCQCRQVHKIWDCNDVTRTPQAEESPWCGLLQNRTHGWSSG